MLFRLDAETAHEAGMSFLRSGLGTEAAQRIAYKLYGYEFPYEIERFGLKFRNPIGVAAGFDKNALVVNQLASLGFGFVEVGTVTFRPQSGNEKPRMFRLPQDGALINRLGFNNDGAEAVAERLSRLDRKCAVGVNIGKNRDVPNEEAVENYLATFDLVHPVADYITVNISSPNTPNLRELQRAENLDELLGSLQNRNRELGVETAVGEDRSGPRRCRHRGGGGCLPPSRSRRNDRDQHDGLQRRTEIAQYRRDRGRRFERTSAGLSFDRGNFEDISLFERHDAGSWRRRNI